MQHPALMVTPLISAEELSAALDGPEPPTLLDVRWALGGPPGIEEYRQGHIPGAHFVDLETELAASPGPGRHPLPDQSAFQAAMRRHGVSGARAVVVYDAAKSTEAARAWWDLKYFGHRDVRVLDGGFAGWVAEDRPAEIGDDLPEAPGDFHAEAGHMPMLDAPGAAQSAEHGTLLDARAAERFRGEVEPVDRVAGHIPGAINLPTTGNVDASGHFLHPDTLRRRFVEAGVEPGAEIGAYCGSGVTAAHSVLALAIAGINAALYVGSWSEWITDLDRPVATGDRP